MPIKPSLFSSLYPEQPCQLAIEVNGEAFCLSAVHKLCGLSGAASFDEANGARLDKYTVAVTLPINDHQIEPAVGWYFLSDMLNRCSSIGGLLGVVLALAPAIPDVEPGRDLY